MPGPEPEGLVAFPFVAGRARRRGAARNGPPVD